MYGRFSKKPCFNRRQWRDRTVCILSCLALFATGLLGPMQVTAQEIRTTDLGKGIHMLEGRGGNIGLSVGEDGVLIVDAQYAPLNPQILAAVAELSTQPLRFALNTHWHFDHVGGNEQLAETGVANFAHENVRALMRDDQTIAAFQMTVPASPQAALPIVTFTDGVTFHLNGGTIRVFHVPAAHTNGDSIVHFVEADVIHMGDVYFNGRTPFIDRQHGGTLEGVVAAVDRVLAIAGPETKIIPGHGPLSNKLELEAYRESLARALPQ